MGNKSITPIEQLAEKLRTRFPQGRSELDPTAKKGGTWYLDVDESGHGVHVQWKPRAGSRGGFGITSATEIGYGEGADEVYQSVEAAYSRVVSLLLDRVFTGPPASIALSELRKERGVSQEDLAARMKVRQAAVSRLERRSDVLVSSLREVVRSMGGELRITARFPDGMERALEFEEGPAVARERTKKKRD
jgi:DNA-binding transcriptional regulator YiaG